MGSIKITGDAGQIRAVARDPALVQVRQGPELSGGVVDPGRRLGEGPGGIEDRLLLDLGYLILLMK